MKHFALSQSWKVVAVFLLVAGATLLFSCTSSPLDDGLQQGNTITLTAVTEGGASTRTAIEAGTAVWWESGDEIAVLPPASGSIVYSRKFTTDLTERSATATFTGTLEDGDDTSDLWAVYPDHYRPRRYENKLWVTLPSTQTARAGSFGQGMNPSVARARDGFLQFQNIGGGIRFTLTSDDIQKVTLQPLYAEMLVGYVEVVFEDDTPSTRLVGSESYTVTLLPSDSGTFQPGQWYYFVTIPVTLSKGFRLTFYKDGYVAAQKDFPSEVTIRRGIFGSVTEADKDAFFENFSSDVEMLKSYWEECMKRVESAMYVLMDIDLPDPDTDEGYALRERGEGLRERGEMMWKYLAEDTFERIENVSSPGDVEELMALLNQIWKEIDYLQWEIEDLRSMIEQFRS